MLIPNRDWANWEDVMAYESSEPPGEIRRRRVTRPRPGHADLAGVLKYDRIDGRDILERASARETTAQGGGRRARQAAAGRVRRRDRQPHHFPGRHSGGPRSSGPAALPVPLNEASDRSEVRVLDPAVEAEIIRRIDAAKKAGDTLGGEAEVVARGVVVGLGQPRELGSEAGRAARRHADVHTGGEGGRDRHGLRGRAAAGLRGSRSD